MTSTPETVATQPDTALERASVVSPEQEIEIWKRKHYLAHQVIGILSAENRELKVALRERTAA